MITFLVGKLADKKPGVMVLNVHGVGYEVFISMTTFLKLPDVGTDLHVYTHLTIREDGHFLYGFLSLPDRALFRELIKISGVGPKLALNVLSGLEGPVLLQALANQDVSRLKALPGVGPKLAERLVVEMRDKLARVDYGLQQAVASVATSLNNVFDEAMEALISLGYKPVDAKKRLEACQQGADPSLQTVESLIRGALQRS